MFKLLTEKERIDSSQFFQFASNTRDLRGHEKKLFLYRSRLNCRKSFFSQRAIIEWNRLPQNVVNAKTVNSFKNRLDDLWTYNRCDHLKQYASQLTILQVPVQEQILHFRAARVMASPHLPEHCPFRVQTKLNCVIFYTFSPCLQMET